MHTISAAFRKTIMALFALVFTYPAANATVYTCVANGNFSSGAIWLGSIAPPPVVSGFDTIRTGVYQVILDQNLTINGPNASLEIDGQLSEITGTYYLSVNGANLSGIGTTDLDSVYIDYSGVVNITNIFGIRKLACNELTIENTGTVLVYEKLYVPGNVTSQNGSKIMFNNNATIYMKGGNLVQGLNGTIQFPLTYYVRYETGAASNTGFELSGAGAGLVDVEVNIGAGNELNLTSELIMHKGTLTLTSGALVLNSNDLTFNTTGDFAATGNGTIKSTSTSDIKIATTSGLTGPLRFDTGGNTVDELTINFGTNTEAVKLGSNLRVTGLIDLQTGKINVQGNKLSLITGATVMGGNANNYIITGTGGSLAADIGSGDSVTYHVGTATHYAPCMITSKNNTVYNGLGVGVNEGVKTMGAAGTLISGSQAVVNATWFLDHSTSTTIDVDVELIWSAAMEVNLFDRQKAYVSQMTGATWDKQNPGPNTLFHNGMYSMKRKNITYLTPMAVFDATTVDVNAIAAKNTFSIYPNPAKDVLYIELKDVVNTQATIHNLSGQIVNSTQISNGNNTINISALPQGMYYIQLNGEGVNGFGKFVKE